MRNKLFWIFLYLSVASSAYSQDKVSVIYCGIGNDIYSIFGHVGIRVSNKDSDVVYNFGTFDPSTPEFVPKFIRGDLHYSLSREDYNQFLSTYRSENREVIEYNLSLSPQETSDIENELLKTYNSNLRYYRYQFLKDNCSTRIYQSLQESLGKRLSVHNNRKSE